MIFSLTDALVVTFGYLRAHGAHGVSVSVGHAAAKGKLTLLWCAEGAHARARSERARAGHVATIMADGGSSQSSGAPSCGLRRWKLSRLDIVVPEGTNTSELAVASYVDVDEALPLEPFANRKIAGPLDRDQAIAARRVQAEMHEATVGGSVRSAATHTGW